MRPINPQNDPAFFKILGVLTDLGNRVRAGEKVSRKDLILAASRVVYPGKTDDEIWDILKAEMAKRGKTWPEMPE